MTHSIIQKSQLEGALRLDAEYYQPELLEYSKKLANSPTIKSLSYKLIHPKETVREYSEDGKLFLLAQNVKSNYIDWSVEARVSKKMGNSLSKNELKDGDVAIVRSGVNFGDTAFLGHTSESVLASADVVIIRPKEINGEYLSTFLNTEIGVILLKRLGYGAAQPHITPDSIGQIRIPRSNKIEKEVTDVINNNMLLENEAVILYSQAEDLLLKELGLKNFEKENELFSIVNLSEAQSAKRVDAEYFQKKYKKLIEKISSQKFKKLGDLVDMKKGFEPGSEAYQEEGIPFIRVSNLTKLGINESNQQYLNEDLYNKLKANFEPQVGEILLSKDATPGIAYVIKEPIEGIVSGGILRLKVKNEIESEYLSLVISSLVGKMQAERDAGGSIIAHWKPEQIKNILIPILPKETQQKIANLVRQSHIARQRSKQLLDEAKQKVEELIEKG